MSRPGTVVSVLFRGAAQGDYVTVQWDGSVRGNRFADPALDLGEGDRVLEHGGTLARAADPDGLFVVAAARLAWTDSALRLRVYPRTSLGTRARGGPPAGPCERMTLADLTGELLGDGSDRTVAVAAIRRGESVVLVDGRLVEHEPLVWCCECLALDGRHVQSCSHYRPTINEIEAERDGREGMAARRAEERRDWPEPCAWDIGPMPARAQL